jgi:Concanavalin A-like lectin/glucanases superfamily
MEIRRAMRFKFVFRILWSILVLVLVGAGLAHTAAAQVPASNFPEGLTGYWPFDGSGTDLSGNARNLTLVGGLGFAQGKFGQGLDFHLNNNQYAIRPVIDDAFNFRTNDFSIQLWINLNEVSTTQVVVENFYGCCGPGGWSVATHGNDWEIGLGNAIGRPNGAVNIEVGQWHHTVIRRSGPIFDIFFDGIKIHEETISSSIPDAVLPLRVGNRNDVALSQGQSLPVDGRIDDVAIWNRAITDAEVAYLWSGVPQYNVCLLYDPAKAVKSGSTIPVKLQLCDDSGHDLSSSSITAHGVSITQSSILISGTVQDGGNANPDFDFRFDSTLGTTGGYIFNLSTKGLPTGTYNLNFTVTGDLFMYAAPFQVK